MEDINSKSNSKTGIGELCKVPLDNKSEKIEDDGKKANVLANFFSSVYSTEKDSTIPELTIKQK